MDCRARRPARWLLAVAVGVGLASLLGGTTAEAQPSPNTVVKVTEAPFSAVAGATVVARDAEGRIVGRATTNSFGIALLRLSRNVTPARPVVVAAAGGRYATRVDGPKVRPFDGTLMAEIGTVGLMRSNPVSLATTAAVRLRDATGGSYRSRLARVARALGARPSRLTAFADPLGTYSYAVGIGKFRRALQESGGHEALIGRITTAAAGGTRIGGLRASRLTVPHVRNGHFASQRQPRSNAPSPRQASTGSSPGGPGGAPCTSTIASPPPPSLPTTGQDVQSVINISLSMSEGLFALSQGDPTPLTSAIYGSVTGNAFGPQQTEVSTNDLQTDLQAISAQLDCISNQIAALQTAMSALSLQVSLESLETCEAAIASGFASYQTVVQQVAGGASPTSPAVKAIMSKTASGSLYSSLEYACDGGLINQVLFNGSAGQTAAWPQLLKVATGGGFTASDSTALSPQTLESLQLFLQYWGTLEYQQAAMLNDIYNYACTYLGESGLCAAGGEQETQMGAAGCLGVQPTVAAINPSSAASWCAWQQNIAAVWPGTVYSDEILQYGGEPSTGVTLAGEAWMAVPISLAYQSLSPWTSPGTTCGQEWTGTYFCAGNDYALYSYLTCTTTPCGWAGYSMATLAADALAYFQTLPPQQPSAVETYYQPQTTARTVVDYTGQPWSSAVANLLETALSDAANTYAPNPPSGHPAFGSTAFVGTSTVYNSIASGPLKTSNPFLFDITCQSSWTNAPATNPTTNTTYQESSPVAGSCGGEPNDAVAVLLSRAWTQGTTWNPAPVIGQATSTPTTGGTAVQLVAQNCPTGGCVWGIEGTLPSQVTFNQTTGQLMVPTGTKSFAINVVAANNYAVSTATSVTPVLESAAA